MTFDLFLNPDPQSQNVNKKKRTDAILTDTSVRNAVKKCTARLGANEKN